MLAPPDPEPLGATSKSNRTTGDYFRWKWLMHDGCWQRRKLKHIDATKCGICRCLEELDVSATAFRELFQRRHPRLRGATAPRTAAGRTQLRTDRPELMSEEPHSRMLVVFFIYGLTFFLLGVIILRQPRAYSSFKLANTLWLLAAFGLLHGLNEWMDMFLTLGETYWTAVGVELLKGLSLSLGVLSFVFLLQFGVRSILFDYSGHGWLGPVSLIASLTVAAVITVEGLTGSSQVIARYLLGFPGASLTAVAFFRYAKAADIEALESPRITMNLRGAAIAFGVYGILAGVIGPQASFFPASYFNQETFLDAVGVPIQIFRAACALAATYFIAGILDLFDVESKRRLERAHEDLLLSHGNWERGSGSGRPTWRQPTRPWRKTSAYARRPRSSCYKR